MSVENTLQFLHSRSQAGQTARPLAGQRRMIAGDVVAAPHYRYPPGQARAAWFDSYWGGGRKSGLGVTDAIKHRRSGYTGTVIRTRRGTIVQTGGVAGKSRADAIRLARTR